MIFILLNIHILKNKDLKIKNLYCWEFKLLYGIAALASILFGPEAWRALNWH